MQTVLITGGTGLVGKSLTTMLLKKGYKVIVLTRSLQGKQNDENFSFAEWDVHKNKMDIAALMSADYIIHLAGAGVVDKKWTAEYKKEILDSRTLSSKLIIDSLRTNPHHVKAIISASAIGWYGPDISEGHFFVEEDAADKTFLGETCMLWEKSIEDAQNLGIRVCKLRTGIVLANEGGALKEFKKPIQMGVAGILGSGKQMISWIHIEDMCRMYLFAIENNLSGSYNAVAPLPVTNKELTLKLAKSMRGNFFIPMHVPEFVLRIMMGQRSIEILKSTTVSAKKISAAGFIFVYPSIDAAIKDLNKT